MPTGSDITTSTLTTATSNSSIHNNDNIMTTTMTTTQTTKETIQDTETFDETTEGTTINGAKNGNNEINCGTKLPTGTYDPTPYIQRARVTRPAPPKPSCNPMQFVQIKPCTLYQNAQEQLKRAEEVKKVKEIKKEEPEDWQNNLDNWKSSRRKRVEHIIDRVVEVKKLELEEHDRTRRKSKTFSEMMEERGERKGRTNKLASLTVYTEDEANDLSDLGIGTSSASGKSSLSEDYDNHSVMSDNVDTEKHGNFGDIDNNSINNDSETNTRDYISSPGYDTSSSTAPASSPDPCEYTYEGAIQDYKTRISRTTTGTSATSAAAVTNGNGFRTNLSSPYSKDSTPERTTTATILNDNQFNNHHYQPRRGSKIEDRLINFEIKSSNDINDLALSSSSSSSVSIKKDLPKVDVLKRRELFEKDKENSISSTATTTTSTSTTTNQITAEQIPSNINNNQKRFSGDFSNTKSIRERLTSLEKVTDDTKKLKRISSGDITSIKDRLQNLEIKQKKEIEMNKMSLDGNSSSGCNAGVSVVSPTSNILPIAISIKDRMSSLQNAVTKEEIKKPVMLVDEHQLELLKKEDYNNKQAAAAAAAAAAVVAAASAAESSSFKSQQIENNLNISQELLLNNIHDDTNIDTDREDSGIHTTDVSCSVSQTDEQPELVNDESHCHHINEDSLCQRIENHKIIEKIDLNNKLNLKIDNNEIQEINHQNHHESTEELSICSTELQADLESSVNEAIEMALQAIDHEEISLESPIKKIETNKINQMCEPIYENVDEKTSLTFETTNLRIDEESIDKKLITNEPIIIDEKHKIIPVEKYLMPSSSPPTAQARKSLINTQQQQFLHQDNQINNDESYYQVPKSCEPYYEVPKSNRSIPVYENIDLFYTGQSHLIDGIADGTKLINTIIPPMTIMEPPKEKPPPPPIDNLSDNDEIDGNNTYEIIDSKNSTQLKKKIQMNGNVNGGTGGGGGCGGDEYLENNKPIKRMNSTKRIKKEMRNKRSSFLGIEGTNDDDSFLELTVAPPPDMMKLLQEERRLEKQLYMKAGLYDSSDTGESRDSGVSENHSRQSSEPFTNSSDEHVDLLRKKEKEIIEVLEKEEEKQKQKYSNIENWEQQQHQQHHHQKIIDPGVKINCIEEQIREQEEVLRVERELLQLEQEELKRQRENLIIRKNLARRELEHGAKMLMSANRRSLQDINAPLAVVPTPTISIVQQQQQQQQQSIINHYANVPNQIYKVTTDYRKSMSDLQDFTSPIKRLSIQQPPAPPAKPLRSQMNLDNGNRLTNFNVNVPGGGLVKIANQPITTPTTRNQQQTIDDYVVPIRNYQSNTALHHGGNMTRNTLLALSATPKPKFTDAWIQQSSKKQIITASDKANEIWLHQHKRKSVPDGFNYNKHWLIQEAEQRRIDQQRGLINSRTTIGNGVSWNNTSNSNVIQRNGNSDNKPLPDAVIQTLTQRVQNKGIGERKRLETRSTESLISTVSQSNSILNSSISPMSPLHSSDNGQLLQQQDKILSVSGKKKCSHCGDELGRGAAMIIESLRLFYHINCFKCCVCHVQLGDGLNGTDVRVRNHKLHCHNCYSSDDGIKFSCV